MAKSCPTLFQPHGTWHSFPSSSKVFVEWHRDWCSPHGQALVFSDHVHLIWEVISSIPQLLPHVSRLHPKLWIDEGTSLVVQWKRIGLPMQGSQVQSLVWEDTSLRATKPMSHNFWTWMPQLQEPTCLEIALHKKRSNHNEKPGHHNEEWALIAATGENPYSNEDPAQPKINK